jgi:hypothetical protein
VAIGGFLIMMGMTLTSIVLLALFNLIDIGIFEYETHMFLLTLTLLLIGILDFVGAIILLRR